MPPYELHQSEFTISTETARLQMDAIVAFLSRSYWAQGRTRDVIERSIEHSLCFGLYAADRQIGFARVVTDRATFAYLCDVFVDESYRGQGLGKWLMAAVMNHPDLQGLRRWTLATRDAHGLYRQFGWTELKNPGRWMEVYNPPLSHEKIRDSE
jgi:GNAT superfamily N-acetyltransferase